MGLNSFYILDNYAFFFGTIDLHEVQLKVYVRIHEYIQRIKVKPQNRTYRKNEVTNGAMLPRTPTCHPHSMWHDTFNAKSGPTQLRLFMQVKVA